MDQAVQVYAGTAARASAVPSPSTGMVAYSTATGLQVFNGSAWTDVGGIGYGAATGGQSTASATIGGTAFTILTFTATGTLTNTKAGFFDYLAVGGGGGASNNSSRGAGGGAGQLVIGSVYLDANQTITIGGGGSFVALNSATQGTNTTIAATSPFTQTALGNVGHSTGPSGAYVGGGQGSVGGATSVAITESTALGYRGGNSGDTNGGGGGGGATGRGGTSVSTTGGAGGAGFDVSVFIGGSELRKAMGGGGGGQATGGAAATGGVAGSANTTPSNGNANSGGGGGGGSGNITTGNGGSGICYIRFRT